MDLDPSITGSAGAARRLVPMKVGSATVFIDQVGVVPSPLADDRIYAVGALDPTQAFERAGEALREILAWVEKRSHELGDRRPDDLTVEFSLGFEVSGQASIIPIFVSSSGKFDGNLKITAVWHRDTKA